MQRLFDGRLGLGRGSINISAVRETDSGLYRCRVTFPNRSPPARNNGTFYFLDVDGTYVTNIHILPLITCCFSLSFKFCDGASTYIAKTIKILFLYFHYMQFK